MHISGFRERVHMVIIGTRGSALALAQTEWIKDLIHNRYPSAEVEVKVIKTSADRDQTASLRSASTVGVFVKELEQALLAGDIDIAVHSMKDLPTQIPSGLRIAAIPEREDARDALIANKATSLFDLPAGSLVGTGSIRRQAQILASRPDLRIMDIRGNVDTRLKKLQNGACDAIILACAGLRRLGLQHRITSQLNFEQMLPAPGQGALAIETRVNDPTTEAVATPLNHPATALAVISERKFLERMGGGCNVPVAVYAQVTENTLEIDGLVASPDGRRVVRDSIQQSLQKANEAADLLADRILSRGGRAILDEAI
jgi:hydroxymethylbilane synthase